MKKSKIVFLDRDGVLNKLRVDYVKHISEFEILPNVGNFVSQLTMAGFKIVVITNQSAIERNLLSIKELEKIHDTLKNNILKYGGKIDKIYFCPHKPEAKCQCRKPNTKLFELAFEDFAPVDLKKSWMIGDSKSDEEAAHKMNLNYFGIECNSTLENVIAHILKS